MSERPSPTPSEDNRRNVREETAIMAIDKALINTEQSREDLLNSFSSLNKGDVDKNVQQGMKALTPGTMKSIMSNILSKGRASRLDTSLDDQIGAQKLKGHPRVDSRQITECKVDGDGIEEEVLDEGHIEGRLSTARVINVGTNLKVDNFIEDEDDDTSQLDSYVASFGEETCLSSKTDTTSESKARTNTPLVTPAPTLDEADTDKLLMNFLADLQNEENSQRGYKLAARTDASSESSIDAFIHKNKTPKEEETVDFSDDGDDAAMALVDNSNDTNISVVVNHEELDEITKPECSEDTLPPKVKTRMVMDSEGNISEEQSNSDSADQSEPVSNLVFPGEIVAEETSEQHRNDRLLEFKVTYRDPTDNTQDAGIDATEHTNCDEVEPFHLDADFDYDNVVLTPKYSEADMEHLKRLIQTSAALT